MTVFMFAQLKLGANGFSYQCRYDYFADYKVQRLQDLQSLAAIQKPIKRIRQQHYLQVATTRMDTFPYLAALYACLCIWPSATCLRLRMCLASPQVANLGAVSCALCVTAVTGTLVVCGRSMLCTLVFVKMMRISQSGCGSRQLLKSR